MRRGVLMKAKKAIKRLDKVDQLLTNVIDRYGASEPGTRELLDSAKRSVVRVKATLKRRAGNETENGSPAKVNRKAAAGDSKVQSNGAKRKGANVEIAQAASKSA